MTTNCWRSRLELEKCESHIPKKIITKSRNIRGMINDAHPYLIPDSMLPSQLLSFIETRRCFVIFFIYLSFIFVALSCKSRQWVIGIIQNLKIDVLCSTSIKIAQYYFIFILRVKKVRMTLIIDLLSRDCYIYDKPSSKRIQSVVL